MPRDTLRPKQIEAAAFLRECPAPILVGDPGVGKSAIALDAVRDADRVLILCDAAAAVAWPSQIRLWDRSGRPFVRIEDGNTPIVPATRATVIVTYDLVGLKANRALRDALRRFGFQTTIVDECQKLKSPGANRTKAAYGVRLDGKKSLVEGSKIIRLSGTPMPNHAGELYTHAAVSWQHLFQDVPSLAKSFDQSTWEDRYCRVQDTPYGPAIRGSKNLDDLRDRLAPVSFRLRKADVAAEMPPLSFVPQPIWGGKVDAEPWREVIAAYAGGEDEVVDVLAQTPLSTVRRELGLSKVGGAIDWATSILEGGNGKLVLFAVHTEVIDKLVQGLANFAPAKIDGRDNHAARTQAVERFQADPACRLFVGQIVAAGTGITLTAASDVGIVEPSWSPSENYQAACRCHRIGQKDAVVARVLMIPDTIDEAIARVYARKAREIAEMFE